MLSFNWPLDGVQPISTPVGMECGWCAEPIADGDAGVVMPLIGSDGVTDMALHRECHLRQVFGSVGHQLGRCSCYGGTEEDPPGMTRREAARAAMALAESRLGRGRRLV